MPGPMLWGSMLISGFKTNLLMSKHASCVPLKQAFNVHTCLMGDLKTSLLTWLSADYPSAAHLDYSNRVFITER